VTDEPVHSETTRARDSDDAGPLERVFGRARQYPPTPEQLAHFLRAVPKSEAGSRRAMLRVAGFLATAAAIGAAAFLTLGFPGARPAFALSMIGPAMRSVTSIRTIAESYESWECRGQSFAWRKRDGTQIRFWDMQQETHATYQANRGCVILSTCEPLDALFAGAVTLEELTRQLETLGEKFDDRWNQQETEQDGRQVVMLTRRSSERTFADKLVFDVGSGRLLERVGYGGRARFEYPETAPEDIYDLGVPVDAKVVDGRASPELLDLRRKVISAQASGYGMYRAVIGQTDGMLQRVVSDGQRLRVEWLDADRELMDEPPELLSRVRAELAEPSDAPWSQVEIFDGHRGVTIGFDQSGSPSSRRVMAGIHATAPLSSLDGHACYQQPGSFFDPWYDRQDIFLGGNDRGWIGVRALGQANSCSRPWVSERWFDPLRGYLPVLMVGTDYPAAEWQLDPDWEQDYSAVSKRQNPIDGPARSWECEVLEWAELRPGQWYPAVRRSRSMIQEVDGQWIAHERPNVTGWLPEKHMVIAAVPLQEVADSWFEILPEWLAIPAQNWP